MNITHGLRRALQVNSCVTAAVLEGRRRTWREIGDRVSRFAGALRPSPRPRRRIAVLMLNQYRHIECYLAASWGGGRHDRSPQHPLEYPG
jgi:long-chain acyl-CoA synthetase